LVGAGLVIESGSRPAPALWLSTVLKLVLMPTMALTLALALGVRGTELAVVAICSAVPTASNAYILARQLGGDAPLMAQIITVQTLLSALTLPLALLAAEWIG
jgi:predicted permease